MSNDNPFKIESLEERIEKNTRILTEDIHVTIDLDTSVTDVRQVSMYKELGITIGTSITVLDDGNGLYIGTSLETPFEVVSGDSFDHERFEFINWKGSGVAGTAKLRIGGVI